MAWLGLPQPPLPPEPGAAAALLERLLRLKCLVLVAVALRLRAFRCGPAGLAWRQQSLPAWHRRLLAEPCCSPRPTHAACRWQAKLPAEVAAAGRCGAPCPLFWPQDPEWAPPPLEAPGSPTAAGARRLGQPSSLVGSLREAAALLLSRAQHATQQALRAVDWPAGEESAAGEPAGAVAEQPEPAGAAEEPAAAADGGREAPQSQRQQWRLLRFALQDWLESAWQVRCGVRVGRVTF